MAPFSSVGTAKPVRTAFVAPRQPSKRWAGWRNAIVGLFSSRTHTPPAPTDIETRTNPPYIEPNSAPVPAEFSATANKYLATIESVWRSHDWTNVEFLFQTLRRCWKDGQQVFLCGNGGSAANAIHLANDYLYGIDKKTGHGLRVTALAANASVLTCLANDISYDDVFAQQLEVLARPGDVLIALSGSGNSPNIVKALLSAKKLGVRSFAILGFTGGQALELADHPIHFPVHDMQAAEDLQVMVGHMGMQWLSRNRPI